MVWEVQDSISLQVRPMSRDTTPMATVAHAVIPQSAVSRYAIIECFHGQQAGGIRKLLQVAAGIHKELRDLVADTVLRSRKEFEILYV